MQLVDLRTAVRRRIGVPDSDAFFTDDKVTGFINSALQSISMEADWDWLEGSETITTVNGTQSYAVAAVALRTVDVLDPTKITLIRKPIDEVDWLGTATAGYVRIYGIYNNKLVLFPVPNTALALTHRYVQAEPTLVGDSDVPLMSAQFQEALISLTCMYAEQAAGNWDMAQGANAQYQAQLKSMLARASRRAVTPGGGQDPTPTTPTPGAQGQP